MEVELLEDVVLAIQRDAATAADVDLDGVAIVDDHAAARRHPVRMWRIHARAHRAGQVDGRLLCPGGARLVVRQKARPNAQVRPRRHRTSGGDERTSWLLQHVADQQTPPSAQPSLAALARIRGMREWKPS